MTLLPRPVAPLAFSALALLVNACSAPDAEPSGRDEGDQTGVDASLFRERATWTGRLVLPKPGERTPDGAVKIEIHNSPDAALRGKTVWLRFSTREDVRDHVRGVTRSVAFNAATRKSMAAGNVHPERIDGWSNVGPLESLAGARKDDDMLVALPTARREGDGVVIDREPVMIAGDYVGLITFKAPAGNGSYKVTHYRKASGDFSGAEQTLAFDASTTAAIGNDPAFAPLVGIEKSPTNGSSGFYVHAVRASDGNLHVRALVPRHLRQVPAVNARNGASAALLYTTTGMWDPVASATKGREAKGSSSSTLLVPNGNAGEAAATGWREGHLERGAKLLVVHTFGAIGPKEDGPLRTGHFAFGIATIADEPLTGELALDVEYEQIYAHNPNGIVAGSHDYASYAGSFARGWLYSRPLADVALYLPALNRDFTLGGVAMGKPIEALQLELQAMAARYRTGLGTGAAIVTPANSCVQDSSKALYFALAKLDEAAAQPAVKDFIAAHPDDPAVKDFQVLETLAGKVEHYLSPLGFTRGDWKNQAGRLAATDVNACPGGIVGAAFCALASFGTVVPRRASDLYTETLIVAGAGGIVTRSNDLGNEGSSTFPLSPTTLFR